MSTLLDTIAAKPAGLRKLDSLIWSLIAAVALFVLLVPLLSDFKIAWPTFIKPSIALMALLVGIWFYRCRRTEWRFASAFENTAQIGVFAAFAAPLSYIAASTNLPLHDGLLDAMDRALGFDWAALLAWMNAHPKTNLVLLLAYGTFIPQTTMIVLALAFTSRLIHLRIFILAFILTTLVTIAIFAILPAQGTWGFYHYSVAAHPAIVTATDGSHLVHFLGLRDGTFRMLMASGTEGIITFPSLHGGLGIIFILALWPIPYLRWIGLVVNLLLIASIPIEGGHYLVDVIGGLAVALLCWIAASRLAAYSTSQLPLRSPAAESDLVPGE